MYGLVYHRLTKPRMLRYLAETSVSDTHGPAPKHRIPAVVNGYVDGSVGQGGFAKQQPPQNADSEGNQPNEAESKLGGLRQMVAHMRQEVTVDLRLPLLYFYFDPYDHCLPAICRRLFHTAVTGLLPRQRGAWVVYNSTYRRGGVPCDCSGNLVASTAGLCRGGVLCFRGTPPERPSLSCRGSAV